MHADRVYAIEKGAVSDVGDHEAFLASKGLYFALWKEQGAEKRG